MKKIAFLSASFIPVAAMAHAGHGPVDQGLAHYLTSPIHLIGIAAAAALGVVLYRAKQSKKRHA